MLRSQDELDRFEFIAVKIEKAVNCGDGARDSIMHSGVIRRRWLLPEGWNCVSPQMSFALQPYCCSELETAVMPPEMPLHVMSCLHLEVSTAERACPSVVTIPLRSRTVKNDPVRPHS